MNALFRFAHPPTDRLKPPAAGPSADTAIPHAPDPLFARIDMAVAGDARKGRVRWSPLKSLWWSGMTAAWLLLGNLYFSWSAVAVFLVLSALTLCLGHSLGMHRLLIHRAYKAPRWLERVLVYLGTLVGLGGPFTMMQTHDLRDWAQRRSACHAFLCHRSTLLKDFWWQLHCDLQLDAPPAYRVPAALGDDRFYRLLQSTSMLQQIPPALILLALGGWGWVAWGICGRVAVSMFGHWIVGHFAHRCGPRDWHVAGAAVQGHNLPWLGLITFGECWHNNHHAFPGSARLGLRPNQFDPGWRVLLLLERLGLVWDLKTPNFLPVRRELRAFNRNEEGVR